MAEKFEGRHDKPPLWIVYITWGLVSSSSPSCLVVATFDEYPPAGGIADSRADRGTGASGAAVPLGHPATTGQLAGCGSWSRVAGLSKTGRETSCQLFDKGLC